MYETPVVNNNVPVITERDYVNTKPKESQEMGPVHTLNEQLHDELPNMEYETQIVNNIVPVITESDYVNTKPTESQQMDSRHIYVNVDNEHDN